MAFEHKHASEELVSSVRAAFSYDAESGVITRNFNAHCRNGYAGSIAGSISQGYREIRHRGMRFRGTHLIWLIVHGRYPACIIDHINGVTSDDRLLNLREASISENAANSRRHIDRINNLPKGVYACPGNKPFMAAICINRKKKTLGYFDTPQEAADAYQRAAISHFGEFAKIA